VSTTARKSAVTVAALLAGALLVSGCSSEDGKSDGAKGGDKGGDGAKPGNSAPAEEPTDGAGSGDQGGSGDEGGSGGGDQGGGKGGKTAGVWKLEGGKVVLTIVADTVTLLREEGRNCTGPLGPDGKSFALKCQGGGDESRTAGSLGPVQGKSVKVTWKTGKTETYKRVTDVPVEIPEN
jgi:hypothetical protein